MPAYDAARANMVENQVRPNRVTDDRIIAAMAAVPRERFVGEKFTRIAYVDQDIAVSRGRYLMEPMVLARLLQAAAIMPGDVVLDIGCATGYSTAVLARLADTVVSVESDAELAETAIALMSELDADNTAVVTGALAEGYAKQAPYDVIVLEGAVEAVPASLSGQLSEGGRLVAVVTDRGPRRVGNLAGNPLGRAMLLQRMNGALSRRILFDASVPPLPGFDIERGFVF
jgi:protein-L-isoaspartate(D-aspartate) O-methyltransferase